MLNNKQITSKPIVAFTNSAIVELFRFSFPLEQLATPTHHTHYKTSSNTACKIVLKLIICSSMLNSVLLMFYRKRQIIKMTVYCTVVALVEIPFALLLKIVYYFRPCNFVRQQVMLESFCTLLFSPKVNQFHSQSLCKKLFSNCHSDGRMQIEGSHTLFENRLEIFQYNNVY
ncbi:hypothetical protein T4B_10074 [Trichinella pseudospiralis]|uniref:Uncharacterized protein n=1 Tax=Trichinella pseudospiralis TaxID=6337 RepID=A0A0V1I6R3_TRIPS|nr:hypothetical protein T4B_10074 [Trichinella pseudospiralis]